MSRVSCPDDGRIPPLEGCDHVFRIEHTQCRLRDERDPVGIGDLESLHVLYRGDEMQGLPYLTFRSLNFGVAVVADQDYVVARFRVAPTFVMNLADQRARGVDDVEFAAFAARSIAGETPCALNTVMAPGGNLLNVIDKDGAARAAAARRRCLLWTISWRT